MAEANPLGVKGKRTISSPSLTQSARGLRQVFYCLLFILSLLLGMTTFSSFEYFYVLTLGISTTNFVKWATIFKYFSYLLK